MNHHRRNFLALLVHVGQTESEGQLEVKLDGCALVGPKTISGINFSFAMVQIKGIWSLFGKSLPPKSVHNCDVDFGTVERTISWIELPLET